MASTQTDFSVVHVLTGIPLPAISSSYPLTGRFERMPYSNDDMRSVYHTRAYDITKLMLVSLGAIHCLALRG